MPQACKQNIDVEPSEAQMLEQAQAMFKTMASARVSRGSDDDLKMNEHTPDWNRKAFAKNSKKHDVMNVVLKQNKDTYMELCFIYANGEVNMYVKSYTKNDNSLTIYDGNGRYIEKGLYDPITGFYGKYWTKNDIIKKGRIAADPEINGGMLSQVTVYCNCQSGNNYLPSQASMPPVWSYTNPFPDPVYYYPGYYTASTSGGISLTYDDYYNNSQYQAFLSGLNDAEKSFFRAHPQLIPAALASRTASINAANRLFILGNDDNHNGNAFKHAFWSAQNAYYMGAALAKELGLAHEADDVFDNRDIMDLHNNDVGINIGVNYSSSYGSWMVYFERQALLAVANGTCWRLSDPNGFTSPIIITDETGRK